MSFYMQLKLLGLQRNLIFNQGSFFEGGRGRWGCGQSDLENSVYLRKNPGQPLFTPGPQSSFY